MDQEELMGELSRALRLSRKAIEVQEIVNKEIRRQISRLWMAAISISVAHILHVLFF